MQRACALLPSVACPALHFFFSKLSHERAYESETWVLSKSDEASLGVFERKFLRAIFGPTNDNGEWRIKYKNELYTLYNENDIVTCINPYPTAFPYGNGMVLHFYQQQESSTTKTVHKVINKGLKTYV